MNTPTPFFAATAEPRAPRTRDMTWDRIVFQPPELLNPRQVFDPTPFRAQAIPRPVRARSPLPR